MEQNDLVRSAVLLLLLVGVGCATAAKAPRYSLDWEPYEAALTAEMHKRGAHTTASSTTLYCTSTIWGDPPARVLNHWAKAGLRVVPLQQCPKGEGAVVVNVTASRIRRYSGIREIDVLTKVEEKPSGATTYVLRDIDDYRWEVIDERPMIASEGQ